MSEAPRSDNPRPEVAEQGPLSRRSLFKKAAKGALAVGGLVVAAKVGLPILFPPGVPPQDEDTSPPTIPRPEGLPEDTLTEEELAKAHIRIIPTDEVKLHLRKGVFDFDLFRDAKEGRLKEVVVVLVDHPNLSWNTGNKMTEEVRLVFQTAVDNPWEMSEKSWPSELTPEERKKVIANWAENNNTAGTFKKIGYQYLDSQALDFFKENPETIQRGRRYNELLNSHPEMKNKVYIFLAVGGKIKPHPSQSYPSIDEFEEFPGFLPARSRYRSYRYSHRGTKIGPSLRHEVYHYRNGSVISNEYAVDTRMFESIKSAWEEYEKTGKTDRYPFIFETPEGLTFTKKREAQTTSVQSA